MSGRPAGLRRTIPTISCCGQKHRRRGVFFCGGLQIDAHGNSNLIGIGREYQRLAVRGPGGIGTCNATVHAGRYHLVTTSHTPRVLVERCDFVSAVGFGDGSPGFRDRLRLPPGGPRFIITPLCVFDFDPVTSRARLASVHPGVDAGEVRAKTGFEFPHDSDIPVTAPPTEDELSTLRTRIDPQGALR